MSNSRKSGQDPDPSSLKRDRNGSDHLAQTLPAADIPPDPFLKSGSFIDATTPAKVHGMPEPPQVRRSSDGAPPACLAAENSNGSTAPVPENTASPAESQPRRPPPPSPNWLPPGWFVEDRVRSSGVTAGTVDKYYVDPVSGRRFRSKNEVLYFLETGMKLKRRKIVENTDADTIPMEGSGGHTQKKSGTKAKSSPLKFDFLNVPETVKWVLADSSQGSWTPFIGDEKVPEPTTREWNAAFTALTSRNGGQTTF